MLVRLLQSFPFFPQTELSLLHLFLLSLLQDGAEKGTDQGTLLLSPSSVSQMENFETFYKVISLRIRKHTWHKPEACNGLTARCKLPHSRGQWELPCSPEQKPEAALITLLRHPVGLGPPYVGPFSVAHRMHLSSGVLGGLQGCVHSPGMCSSSFLSPIPLVPHPALLNLPPTPTTLGLVQQPCKVRGSKSAFYFCLIFFY